MAIVILRISASALLLTVLAGQAQTPAKDIRQPAISDARMGSLLRGLAFEFTESPAGDFTAFAFELDGHPVTVINQVKGLSLAAAFAGTVDILKANQWNRQHFSTRAYLNEKGSFSLGAEVTFGGGATNQMIQEFVRAFCTDVAIFARFLATAPAGPDASPASAAAEAPAVDALASPIRAMAWSQAGPSVKRAAAWTGGGGSAAGTVKIDPHVTLQYDPDQWRPTASRGDGPLTFAHSSGGGYALIFREPTAVPLDSMADLVLANAQAVDPQATIVFRNRKWVNGTAFWILKFEASVRTTPMVYWGHFYAGEGGTVQVVVYAEKSRLPEYEQAFTEFLNGLSISK